jgi:hypothetical protein
MKAPRKLPPTSTSASHVRTLDIATLHLVTGGGLPVPRSKIPLIIDGY